MCGLGFKVLDVRFKVLALDFGLEGLGFMVWALGLGFRFRVYTIAFQTYCIK